MAEIRRTTKMVMELGLWSDPSLVSISMLREVVARLPKDSGIIRHVSLELADRMLRTYARNRNRFGF